MNLEDWKTAGRIASEALSYGKSLVKPGARIVGVLDAVESRIRELGGEPAFPAQISCDYVAAHFCPEKDDETVLDSQLVSLDVGVQVNGCIGDNAVTVDMGKSWADLNKASSEALRAAEKILQPGVELREIGRTIQEVIVSHGFSPVKNLSGHGLGKYRIHKEPTIPNFDNGNTNVLKEGMAIAIEPFATNGEGLVVEASHPTLFSFVQAKNVRNPYARNILKLIEKYKGLPFTTRWLTEKMSSLQASAGLRELLQKGIIHSYPPLVEKKKGMVAQTEDSFFIGEKVVRLTKS